jgi:hypothetical protein
MTFLMIRHKVEDYDRWKITYDEHKATRDEYGVRQKYLLRNIDNMNEVIALFEVDDLSKAKEFVSSPSLKEALQKSGVQGEPDVDFLKE